MVRLDRIIAIEKPVIARDVFGGELVSWAEVAKAWAHVNQTGVSERFEQGSEREQALRHARMRIRWRGDVDETMRVVYDGYAWDIEGIGELGYRRELELHCRADVDGPPVSASILTVRAGLSADAVPTAPEFTFTAVAGSVDFGAFMDMHVLLWRPVAEADITVVVFTSDPTQENQIGGFTRQATPLELDSVEGVAWVSNQRLTFPDEHSVLQVA